MYTYAAALQNSGTRKKRKILPLQVNFAIFAAIVALGMAYLVSINSLSTKGYEIRRLEQKIKNLEATRKNLEVQSSNLQSITRIQQEAAKLNFVPVGQTVFVRDQDYALK